MSKWSILPLPNGNNTPHLLYKYVTSKSGCEIYLTDLAYIWSQSLSRREILNIASKYNTSIDPSEDEEQYFVLLEKIADALRGSGGSSISLTRGPGNEDLKLITSTNLPPPLDPLEWTFSLLQLPPVTLTKHILLPILKGEANHEARVLSLIDHIKQKDWTLSKLFDKIESSGMDLSTVFPGMGSVRLSRKESIYSQASKHIKGAAPFDEDSWKLEYQAKDADYNLGVHIAKELSGPLVELPADDFILENWWDKLGEGAINKPKIATKGKSQEDLTPRKSPSLAELKDKEEEATQSDDTDEFQTMETPQRLKSPSRKQSRESSKSNLQRLSSPTGNRANESDHDLTEGSSSPEFPKSKSKTKRMGTTGVHTKHEKESSAPSSVETATSEDGDPRPHQQHGPKAKGLGTIGGKQPTKRKQSPVESSEFTKSEDSESVAKVVSKPKAKGLVGMIGGKKTPKKPRQETPIESTASDVSDVTKSKRKPKQAESPIDSEGVPTASEHETEESISPPSKRKRLGHKEPTGSPPTLKQQLRSGNVGGIGQIGGNQKKKQPEMIDVAKRSDKNDDTEEETSPEPRQTSSKPKRPGGKLGIIGGRSRPAPTSPPASDDVNRAPGGELSESPVPSTSGKPTMATWASKQPPVIPEEKEKEAEQEKIEETLEERANRKRQELRKQLEARNKAGGAGGPAKKKRRF
ncbi:hypothetical protein PAAG_06789 [Paracoccidioides lutzii Pb01]|uniref:Non-homologous end-joining factor 1 n=1 Tax=Paracoccidioides lutzii (strain ATCC MYA-826 / Pb01) TaxID=502779 RepID=C1H7P8_PARBA|nr:hypothetical protein PAAG_06789 [Paracoccidioides lutzii Pb01]EEH36371.2 hypothetical protein PAAG_06789 [Paracoccidioides lutzii Pb01]